MPTLYIGCLVVGGGLLLLSLLTGGGDTAGHEGDTELDDAHHQGALASAVPLTSLSFWTFFLAFFGLTGTLLTSFGEVTGAMGTAALSALVGYAAGLGMSLALRRLRRSEADSAVRLADLVGSLGQVVLPVGGGQVGKVRLEVKGRTVELLAHADESSPLGLHHQVLVHAVLDDGSVRVVSAEEPRPEPAPSR